MQNIQALLDRDYRQEEMEGADPARAQVSNSLHGLTAGMHGYAPCSSAPWLFLL